MICNKTRSSPASSRPPPFAPSTTNHDNPNNNNNNNNDNNKKRKRTLPTLVHQKMGFGDRTEPHSESSRKGKLSFVLNGDDEGAGPGHTQHRHRSGSSGGGRQQGNPAGHEYGRGGAEHATSPALMMQSRSTTRQPYAAPDAAAHRGHSGADAPGAEKRGVRKKRQRKFACDTCGFGFYTNSDLQKVRCVASV